VEKREIGRDRAERMVIGNGSPIGLLDCADRPQVCAREALICGLGLMVASDPEGAEIHRRSLQTLRGGQSRLGNIARSVAAPNGAPVTDTIHAGCIDNSLWYIIGNYYTWKLDGNQERLAEFWPSLVRAYTWLDYQDANECGLLEVHEAMDWVGQADYYNSLGPNVLWFAAQKCMSAMAGALGQDNSFWEVRAEDVRYKLNTLLWVGPEFQRNYYLPYMALRGWADRFDSFGNLTAVLFGAASKTQSDLIFDYITRTGIDQPWPVRAIEPVVHPGAKDWRDYCHLPHQQQNGGAWPFLGGLYVAALVKAGRLQEAEHQLDRLAEMNRQSRYGAEWEFNEWFHGVSGRPSGEAQRSWSAAMYIFAHECVRRGEVPVFSRGNGW